MSYFKAGVLIIFCGIVVMLLTLDSFKEMRNKVKNSVQFMYNKKGEQVNLSHEDSSDINVYNVVSTDSDKLYSKDELAKYDGSVGSPGLYLGILGRVYDVGAGEKHYGEGGGYSFFRARDGTKAFMTGEFNDEGLVDDVTGLTPPQMLELENWIQFYDKTYIYKGKLAGNFYTSEGNPTKALLAAVEDIKAAHIKKLEAEREKAKMPPCNSQQKEGKRRVWCTKQSGGVRRDWVGFPRMLYKQGSSSPRCVCVRTEDLNNPQLQEYEHCDPSAESCQFDTFKPKQEL